MIKLHEVAGNIMGSLEAFDGSRAAMDTSKILIVRGMSRKRFKAEETTTVLSNLLDEIGAKEIDMFSKDGKDILEAMDENIRANVEIQGETDIYGIYRLRKSFEAMNCYVEYKLGFLGNIGIFIILWMDKSGLGPRFIELVVSDLE